MARRRKWRGGLSCVYCKRTLVSPRINSTAAFTRDHVKPRTMGGFRVVPCCLACNQLKGHMAPEAWARFMRDNPQWWKLYKKPEGVR